MNRKKNSKGKYIKLILLVVVGYLVFTYSKSLSADINIPTTLTVEHSDNLWWDSTYSYRAEISTRSVLDSVIEFNHAKLVLEGKSNSDGSDLKVISRKDGDFEEIPSEIYKPDSTSTKIVFDSTNINADRIYLYYGNKIPNKISNVLGTSINNDEPNATLGKEVSPVLTISSLKKWVLKEKEVNSLTLNINTLIDIDESSTIYAIINDNKEDKKSVSLRSNSTNIKINDLKAGLYTIYLVVRSGSEVYRSNTIPFYYSAPVYVAWTIDWEGSMPLKKYLDMMDKISTEFSAPMTHYFSPRIYISSKNSELEKITASEWVIDRVKKGDDIGLHMHMQHDMIEEVGIKAKYNEKSWDSGFSGYDTPSTVYSYDEYLKILKWGKTKVIEQLRKYTDYDVSKELLGYRAGGWFANSDTLRAIEDAGFKYDTSGRVPMPIGNTKMTQPWNLTNTTQPYFPSLSDQNSSNYEPLMNLLEIPNNGADSYWSTSKEMIDNFYANFEPGTLYDLDRIVVFLSHPDWFYIDDPKLRELFNEINKYRYDLDNGPIKFTNIKDYLKNSNYLDTIRSINK